MAKERLDDIRELLEDERVRTLMCTCKSHGEAASILTAAALGRGYDYTRASVLAFLEELSAPRSKKLPDDDLVRAEPSETVGTSHTCCVHCYTEANSIFVGCPC